MRFLLSPQKSELRDQQEDEFKEECSPRRKKLVEELSPRRKKTDKFCAAAASPRTARYGTALTAVPAVFRDFPTLELEDVEVAASPATVFYKIRVWPFGRGVCSHHVMKTYNDLRNLHEAIYRETPVTKELPSFPPEPTATTFVAMGTPVGNYLSDLCCCEAAVESHSFGNFFDLTEERRTPGGRGLLPLTEPGLGDARGSSDLPVAPKSAPGGLSSVCKSPTVKSPKCNLHMSKSPCISTGDPMGKVNSEEISSPHGLPTCIVCFSRPQEMAVVPCGHLSMCSTCSSELKECPLCRGPIEKLLRIYAVE
jgi:hypothetical protein